MAVVSDKVLAEAKKTLKELTDTWRTGICRGHCLYLSGDTLVEGHGACHSWVNQAYGFISVGNRYYGWSPKYKKGAEPFLTLSCHSKNRTKGICSAEATDAIILWMARESPFSEFVLNRDDEDSLLNGGVILLCGPGGLTPAQAMWVCKVLRYGVEGAKALDTWLALYKGGVNPLLAVLVCSYVRTIRGTTFGYTGAEVHSTVFEGYLKKVPNIPDLLSGKIDPKAESTDTVFGVGSRNSDEVSGIIRGFCQPYTIDDGWGGKVKGEGAQGPEFVRRVLEWQKANEPAPVSMPNSSTVYLDLDL